MLIGSLGSGLFQPVFGRNSAGFLLMKLLSGSGTDLYHHNITMAHHLPYENVFLK